RSGAPGSRRRPTSRSTARRGRRAARRAPRRNAPTSARDRTCRRRRPVAVEQVTDVVREVEVARNDPDVELEPRLPLELARVTLDARDVGVRVRAEEPHAHRGETAT